jgi:hypothetical protein
MCSDRKKMLYISVILCSFFSSFLKLKRLETLDYTKVSGDSIGEMEKQID